jgi:predicted O-methyltransferase YrrM
VFYGYQERRLKQKAFDLAVGAYRKAFPLFERLGFHVTPLHYTQPIPDTRALSSPSSQAWRESAVAGVDLGEERQVALLEELARDYASEYGQFPERSDGDPAHYYLANTQFGPVDAELYYCMIRRFKPKRIFEIGAGFSTMVSSRAARKNDESGAGATELVAFEPFPHPVLRAGLPGLTKLVITRAQDIPVDTFRQLDAGDILFIDSSHVVQIGSDVEYLFLEVLPQLRPGVLVHVHDIFFPAQYPREWVLGKFIFWNEQYLLQAFLAFNDSFKTLWAGRFMSLRHPELLARAFTSFRPGTAPGSFWFQRVK